MKNPTSWLLLFAIICFSLISCLEELEKTDKIESIDLEPVIEFPLVSSSFSMREMLTEGNSKAGIQDKNGVMTLTYSENISSGPASRFFLIPNQQSPTLEIRGADFVFPSPSGTVQLPPRTISFQANSTDGENLDSMMLKTGSLAFTVNSNMPANVQLRIELPGIKTTPTGLVQQISFNGPTNQVVNQTLSNTKVDLTENGTTRGKFQFRITATITGTGQPINNNHYIRCSFSLSSITFKALFGDLGVKDVTIEDSVDLDVFDNAFKGNFNLLSPSISLDLKNSFGVPVRFRIQNIRAEKGNTSIALTGAAVNSPLNPYLINAPLYRSPVQPTSTTVSLAPTNSNISSLVSSLPNYLRYGFNLELNPFSATRNFVVDDSELTIGLNVELPFHGQVKGLTLSKRFDFDGLGVGDAEQASIRLKTVNSSPLDMAIQVYFLNQNGVKLDSLFQNSSILKGAPVNASGVVSGSATVTLDVPLTVAKFDRIDAAKFIDIQATVSTTNNGNTPVKVSVSDKVSMSMGARLKLKYSTN